MHSLSYLWKVILKEGLATGELYEPQIFQRLPVILEKVRDLVQRGVWGGFTLPNITSRASTVATVCYSEIGDR